MCMSFDMRCEIELAGRKIGPGQPCFVIAEAGVNHNGVLERALGLVDIAAEAGADAVKFQTFSAERLTTRSAPKAAYQFDSTNGSESHFDMLRRLELSEADHRVLARHCAARNILFLSTPFDDGAADMLERLGVAAFKVSSGDLTNLAFLRYVSEKGKPLIVSTGMATLGEVELAVGAIAGAGGVPYALLHCVSGYPAPPSSVNLRAMATLRRAFRVPVGFSDHTEGLEIAFGSVALGACILEKHFTTDRDLPGPDHRASLEPGELKDLVRGIRAIESSLGDGRKIPADAEGTMAAVARRSLVAARRVEPGAKLTSADVTVKRPGTGLAPALAEHVIGREARVAIDEGALIDWEMFA